MLQSTRGDIITWPKYHEATKHTPESIRRSRHFLDWANMPDPFRHYEGVPVIDLPADPREPDIGALDVLEGRPGSQESQDWLDFLSRLLYYSASISAAKQTPAGHRYALRVNPSSGNLHPTEFHLACAHGLYHYRVSSHMLEQRAAGDYGPLQFLLTTIAWREAWKYQSRAYRYCLLDVGHAWQALALAARAIGCEAYAWGDFEPEQYRLAEDEWPMLLVEIQPAPPFPIAGKQQWFGGVPNQLSTEVIRYPLIEEIHAATKRPLRPTEASKAANRAATVRERFDASPPFGEIARRRRSALDFRGGDETIGLAQLLTLLDLATRSLAADFAAGRYIQLYLYVHRVRDLAPGVYRYWPADARLEQLKSGDQRVMAAALSLSQDLAGNSCVTFSMIGDLERATQAYGDRGYRYVHFEAGATGQRLYLAAEALGFQSTGIGAFFDDAVHEYLGIAPESGRQVVYHFACGYAVDDDRLVVPESPR
jgi:SagB-type dehydrogenase family enzyme